MQIEKFFPVHLATTDIPTDMLAKSKSIAETYIESKKWKQQRHFGRTITSYFSDTTVNYAGHFDPKLAQYINLSAREYMNYVGFDPDADLRIETWLNLNLPDTHHSKHEHFGCFMSGVLWLSTPENSGNFTIFDPVSPRAQNNVQYSFARMPNNEYNRNIHSIVPAEGKLIMFPGWLQHQVESNESNSTRISIAFNIWMTQNGTN